MYNTILVAFVGYLSLVFALGLGLSWYALRQRKYTGHDTSDFILGGRTTHWFLTALSAHAADMSDWLFMGLPAAVYMCGGTQIWIPIGLLCGMWAAWHYVAKPLRVMSSAYGAITIAAFFQKRYNDTQGLIGMVVALISCFFFTIYISVGLKGIGYVLSSIFGIDYHMGIGIALLVILTYMILGGFNSVAVLDMVQGIFLLVMLLMVPLVCYHAIGGIAAVTDGAQAKGISLALIPHWSWRSLLTILLNPFAWCLGYFGMPHILTKFMGTSNPDDMHKAKYVGIIWQLLATGAAVCVGLVGIPFFMTLSLAKPELIFVAMTQALFTPLWAGIILCAIVAATISTVDSQLLVLASIITEDFYKTWINPRATQTQLKYVYTGALIVSACIGLAIAWHEASTIMTLVRYAWAGLGAAFGPLMLVSLYSTYPNRWGALAGIIGGAAVAATWDMLNPCIGGISIYAIVPAYIVSFSMIYGISWVTRHRA